MPTDNKCHLCHPLQTIKPDHKCDSCFGFGACSARFLADDSTTLVAPVSLGCLLVCVNVSQKKNAPLSKKKLKSAPKQHGFSFEVCFSRQRHTKTLLESECLGISADKSCSLFDNSDSDSLMDSDGSDKNDVNRFHHSD